EDLKPTRDAKGELKPLKKLFRTYLGDEEGRKRLLAVALDKNVTVAYAPPGDQLAAIVWMVFLLLPLGLLALFWFSMRRARSDIMGTGFLSSFSRSPAKRYEGVKLPVMFKDVAGLEGVKADLMEIVEFLKSPEKFQKLGGRIPKGVLLNGPPGTGKTLLARAVAGEAGVPFFSVSGSEFIQMFVGVGASRVRDLFRSAKDVAPAIIFIDEIDAVGRQRGAGLGGGHDEREQTLNQILSEMDGFSQTDSVIVLAATNRSDVLDPALLRPGRFDRHITVGRPTQKGRVEIFKVHVRDVPLAENVDLERIAAGTAGLTGADIRNIVNEAALWAARNNKTKVEMADFDYARDKILMGAKREEVLMPKEKEKTAYHEAGHTLLAWSLPGSNRVHKVTIIPRGRALGTTQMLPSEDRLSMSASELRDHLAMLLGGRAAEAILYQETTVGAENDLERASGLARRMVMNWGMSEKLGPVSYKLADDDPFLGREIHQQRQFSEHTLEVIDEEVQRILHDAAERAESLLRTKRADLDTIAQALLKEEELDEKQITALIGPSVHVQSNGAVTITPEAVVPANS
ncbi:MAG TPA: ATP-dependent zinc metalloprotease FtsH, partial [Pirellulaceae bacterium]|nr:ATP-dependent zinc metalloprotease FtsH [Pirellulaceae bacterium]